MTGKQLDVNEGSLKTKRSLKVFGQRFISLVADQHRSHRSHISEILPTVVAEAARRATCSHHHAGPKLTDEPITSWKTLKSSPVFRATPAAAAAASSPRAGLSFWAAFPHARRVSAGVMRYLAERDGELLSQGESTAAMPPRTDTLPPNAILPSSPLRYLTAVRNKEGK